MSVPNILSALKLGMNYYEQRGATLADNIARANMPKQMPNDLAPIDFKKNLTNNNINLTVTSAGHILPKQQNSRFKNVPMETSEITPDGNGIVLEEQTLKLAENSSDMRIASEVYKNIIDMLNKSTMTK